MTDMNRIIKQLEKGKNVKENLGLYADFMMTNCNHLSYVRLALNAPAYYEMYFDQEASFEPAESVQKLTKELNALILPMLDTLFVEEENQEAVDRIRTLRKENIQLMHILNAYADRMTVYEYLVNRMEYQFHENPEILKGYSDETMTEEIMAFLSRISDNSERQLLMMQILEQLPMRMTKFRFFQVLKDGLSLYKGSEKKTLEELVFMIRTAAMLEEPQGYSEAFPHLYEIVRKLEDWNLEQVEEAEYQEILDCLKEGFEELNHQVDLVMLLQEMINDCMVIRMSAPCKMVEVGSRENCQKILKEVISCFDTDTEGHQKPLSENINGFLEQLEGVQENCSFHFSAGDGAGAELLNAYPKEIEQLGLLEKYEAIRAFSSLLSSSHFAELAGTNTDGELTQKEIDETAAKLTLELKEKFHGGSKTLVRALMAKILTILPPFLREYSELEEYIGTSLSSCTDRAEKTACVEILKDLMKE